MKTPKLMQIPPMFVPQALAFLAGAGINSHVLHQLKSRLANVTPVCLTKLLSLQRRCLRSKGLRTLDTISALGTCGKGKERENTLYTGDRLYKSFPDKQQVYFTAVPYLINVRQSSRAPGGGRPPSRCPEVTPEQRPKGVFLRK